MRRRNRIVDSGPDPLRWLIPAAAGPMLCGEEKPGEETERERAADASTSTAQTHTGSLLRGPGAHPA